MLRGFVAFQVPEPTPRVVFGFLSLTPVFGTKLNLCLSQLEASVSRATSLLGASVQFETPTPSHICNQLPRFLIVSLTETLRGVARLHDTMATPSGGVVLPQTGMAVVKKQVTINNLGKFEVLSSNFELPTSHSRSKKRKASNLSEDSGKET